MVDAIKLVATSVLAFFKWLFAGDDGHEWKRVFLMVVIGLSTYVNVQWCPWFTKKPSVESSAVDVSPIVDAILKPSATPKPFKPSSAPTEATEPIGNTVVAGTTYTVNKVKWAGLCLVPMGGPGFVLGKGFTADLGFRWAYIFKGRIGVDTHGGRFTITPLAADLWFMPPVVDLVGIHSAYLSVGPAWWWDSVIGKHPLIPTLSVGLFMPFGR